MEHWLGGGGARTRTVHEKNCHQAVMHVCHYALTSCCSGKWGSSNLETNEPMLAIAEFLYMMIIIYDSQIPVLQLFVFTV